MATRRLNDTKAIVDMGSPCAGDHVLSSEKISNGWLTRSSSCNPLTGEYVSEVEFSKAPPRIENGRAKPGPGPDNGGRSLRRGVDYLRNC